MADIVSHPYQVPSYPIRLAGIAPLRDPDAEPIPPETGDRVLLSSVGVGVPLKDAALFAAAVADMAQHLGYQRIVVEGEQVSGIRPDVEPGQPTGVCPDCQRAVALYPGGKLYGHHCIPPEQP
jgi:hypothetical protein